MSVLLALLIPFGAHAQTKNGTDFSIAASLLRFGYQEFDDNDVLLDREDGYIPGFAIGLSHSMNRWIFAGDFSYHGGEVNYSGQTNATPPVPVNTRTNQNIADLALRSEYWLSSGKNYSYALYLGGSYHYWDRDILPGRDANGVPVSGLFENYTWWTGFIGAKAAYESGNNSWMLDARLFQTINPTIHIKFNGTYDNTTLALGERLGVRLALPFRHAFNRKTNLNIEPYAESYELGRSATTPLTSNGTVVGGVFEPRSQTSNYGLNVGITQHF